MRIAHIINPFVPSATSDLVVAQPICFETMRRAKKYASDMEIGHYACIYPEDEEILPDNFFRTKDLKQSVLDYGKFGIERRLPLFADILDRLYEASDAEYFIQTNADISLMPHFYHVVRGLISIGHESFCINKRIIPEGYHSISEIPFMYSEIGDMHAGLDCFVFPRKAYPKFKMGKVCMGTPWSEATLATSMALHTANFTVFKTLHATFHIGDSRVWRPSEFRDYRVYNMTEYCKLLKKLKKKNVLLLKNAIVKNFLNKIQQEAESGVYPEECLKFIK